MLSPNHRVVRQQEKDREVFIQGFAQILRAKLPTTALPIAAEFHRLLGLSAVGYGIGNLISLGMSKDGIREAVESCLSGFGRVTAEDLESELRPLVASGVLPRTSPGVLRKTATKAVKRLRKFLRSDVTTTAPAKRKPITKKVIVKKRPSKKLES